MSEAKLNRVSMKLLMPLLASIIAISPLAIDLYLPALPILAQQFSTDMPAVQQSLSLYLFGYAMGLLMFGPIADKCSRRRLVIIGLCGFLLISVALAHVSTIEQFLTLRFFQAFIGSAATVVVPGIIREIYGKNTAKGLSYVSMIMMLAPMIAPSIGSALLLHSWQLIFYFLGGYCLLILVLSAKYLPEVQRIKPLKTLSFIGRYKMVLRHRHARLDLISSMMVSLAFFGYITAIPFVYMSVFGLSEFVFSILFAVNVLALMTAHYINTRWVVRKGSRVMLAYGVALALLTSSLLVLFTWLNLPVHFTALIILPLMGSLSMIAVNADALVLQEFAQQSGTATAVIGTLRFSVGALAGPIMALFYDGSARPFALLMWLAIVVVFLCQLRQWVSKK